MNNYANLKVWQRSIVLCRDVYRVTRHLPDDERFGLSSQMRRSVVSIPSNVAEGAAFGTPKQFRHFLRMALGSAHELDTQFVVATEIGLLPSSLVDPVRGDLKEIRAMLVGLHRKV